MQEFLTNPPAWFVISGILFVFLVLIPLEFFLMVKLTKAICETKK